MTLSQATIKRINYLISKSADIQNYNQLAIKSGLNESVIRAILSGQTKNASSQTIFFIANAFGISLSEFYADKMFNVDNIDDN